MIPTEMVKALAEAHGRLDEPTTAAIRIRPEASEAWLVEVIPSMHDDDRVAEPTFFNPGVRFKFPLALIAGNRSNLEAALRDNASLAREVASGEILLDSEDAQHLVEVARSVSHAA